jgi:hypothetical protein
VRDGTGNGRVGTFAASDRDILPMRWREAVDDRSA